MIEEVFPGMLGPLSLCRDVERLWDDGLPSGDKTGWPSIDKHYTVAPGQLTVITGWPGSGKSEWLDALLVNLSHQGWRTALFSPENQPLELHVAKFLEKFSGLPFGPGPTPRIRRDDVHPLLVELAGRFVFVRPPSENGLRVSQVIDAAMPWFAPLEGQKRGLVIDPWNELEHWRPKELSETEYISQQLSFVRNWARANNIHVWIVAHPQKMRAPDGKLQVPRPDMISGSQHWWNKADACITIARDMGDPDKQDVDIHIQKIRFKHIGRPGVVTLRYDRVTGRYYDHAARLREVSRYAAKGDE